MQHQLSHVSRAFSFDCARVAGGGKQDGLTRCYRVRRMASCVRERAAQVGGSCGTQQDRCGWWGSRGGCQGSGTPRLSKVPLSQVPPILVEGTGSGGVELLTVTARRLEPRMTEAVQSVDGGGAARSHRARFPRRAITVLKRARRDGMAEGTILGWGSLGAGGGPGRGACTTCVRPAHAPAMR